MQQLPCFLYEEGKHFALPEPLTSLRRVFSRFVQIAKDGRPTPDPAAGSYTHLAEDAAVFLFPLDLGVYIDSGAAESIGAVVAALPFFAGRERRHILTDTSDSLETIPQPACIFSTSILNNGRPDVIPMAYCVPEHSLANPPSFDWRAIRYDVSFVGNATHPVRRVMVASIRKEAPHLRLFVDFDSSTVIDGNTCLHQPQSQEQDAYRKALFCKSLLTSYCVLCPPGLGPQSIRLYETMHAGRIPIIIENDSRRPLENIIDYASFCCIIPKKSVLHTGTALTAWFANQTQDSLRKRCTQACRVWNTWFAQEKQNEALLNIAQRAYWQCE